MTDDSRISQLEEELKEAKWIAEDADRKYDEVHCVCSLHFLFYLLLVFCMSLYSFNRQDETAAAGQRPVCCCVVKCWCN